MDNREGDIIGLENELEKEFNGILAHWDDIFEWQPVGPQVTVKVEDYSEDEYENPVWTAEVIFTLNDTHERVVMDIDENFDMDAWFQWTEEQMLKKRNAIALFECSPLPITGRIEYNKNQTELLKKENPKYVLVNGRFQRSSAHKKEF